ncbi:unnamed protein product [Urochloa humidicola]
MLCRVGRAARWILCHLYVSRWMVVLLWMVVLSRWMLCHLYSVRADALPPWSLQALADAWPPSSLVLVLWQMLCNLSDGVIPFFAGSVVVMVLVP